MIIILSISSLKIGIFGPKSKNFYFLYKTLQRDKFQVADVVYDKGFFKMFVQEYQISHFPSQT